MLKKNIPFIKITYNVDIFLTEMATMVYVTHVSRDFECKYKLNFSFKNHFFANAFLTPPKSRKCAKVFRKHIYLFFKYIWKKIKVQENKSR